MSEATIKGRLGIERLIKETGIREDQAAISSIFWVAAIGRR